MSDGKYHAETPTGRMRFARRPFENGSISMLQQEWRMVTGNHKGRTEAIEWRDVPVVWEVE